jgi:four helix bundle protein
VIFDFRFSIEPGDLSMTESELRDRTKIFALRIIKLVDALPNTTTGRVLGGQLVRSGTSTAANYRAACRARSNADFVNKISIVEEEADESSFWMELIMDSGLMSKHKVADLHDESEQLVAMMVSSRKTARRGNNRKSKIENRQ